MKKLLDLALAFATGVISLWLFSIFYGPYDIQVSGSFAGEEQPVIVRYNKISGQAQMWYKGWRDLK